VGPEETIATERLVLTPLRPEDAGELVGVLGDPALHRFTGGAARAGLRPTPERVDGEQVWRLPTGAGRP
jgi:RimJ/RimL family protein N-acetyltransferase